MDLVDEFLLSTEVPYEITFSDNEKMTIEGKWLAVNAMYWHVMNTYGLPILKKHLLYKQLHTKTVQQEMRTLIYEDIIQLHNPTIDIYKVLDDALNIVKHLFDLAFERCQEYYQTMDIFKLGRTLQIPQVKAIIDRDISVHEQYGIKAVESYYIKAYEEIYDILCDPQYRNDNYLYPFTTLGIYKKAQLPKVILAPGVGTDVNEKIIPIPMKNSLVEGLKHDYEIAIESLNAKKATKYAEDGMKQTQYVNRSQQIMAALRFPIHVDHDCGTPFYINVYIQKAHKVNYMGRNVLDEDKNCLVMLDKTNIDNYIERPLKMRSVLVCHEPNGGICGTCCGKMEYYFAPNSVIGIIAGSEIMSPVSQKVIGSKHSFSTLTSEIILEEALYQYFVIKNNNVYIANESFLENFSIGFDIDDVKRLSDLEHVSKEERKSSYFTRLRSISIKNNKTNVVEQLNVPLNSIHKNFMYLSKEVLDYSFKHKHKVLSTLDDGVWLNLSKFDISYPVIICPAVNESTLEFARTVKRLFVSKDIRDFHKVDKALSTCIDTIYEKTNVDAIHIEIVLKSCMITSGSNYDIPIVQDPNNVQFAELSSIIARRSLGSQLAFEQWGRYKEDPTNFLFNKRSSIYDGAITFDIKGFEDK